jgi:NAD(P)H-dependent flavin oxidoreductase YrpB (nitropropane dioxygenase family)
MEFLRQVKLIQGGMGAYVSNWRLARAVAMERPGVTAGTVSGIGLDVGYARILELGDPGGHIRRAFHAFDEKFNTSIGKEFFTRYFIPGGKSPQDKFRHFPMQTATVRNGMEKISPSDNQGGLIQLTVPQDVIERVILTTFAEVWLAKIGHSGKIFINFLKKVELPLVFAMYGAMLAGVDGIVVGAGSPEGLPYICSRLAQHEAVSIDIPMLYRESGESFQIEFDPKTILNGALTRLPITRPAFLAIASLAPLVQALAQSPSGAPDGFIIEHHTAGGHNAGPQGPMLKDDLGQPQYGQEDEPDLEAIRAVGLPFWLAGGYGSREGLEKALAAGAAGVQVGTNFALAMESGLRPDLRNAILRKIREGVEEAALVHTTLFSPTGYPFKVVQLPETLADNQVFSDRRRICDIGLLQQRGLTKADEAGERRIFHRCPAGPLDAFIRDRGLPPNAEGKRCLCNGLLATVGLGQVLTRDGVTSEEPAIVTLGNHIEGVRKLSSNGQTVYWAKDAVEDILGEA